MNCPHCGQVMRRAQTERLKRKREYARNYRKSHKWKAYHKAYMEQWRANRKLMTLNIPPPSLSEAR